VTHKINPILITFTKIPLEMVRGIKIWDHIHKREKKKKTIERTNSEI
jgi:hypothetical protein